MAQLRIRVQQRRECAPCRHCWTSSRFLKSFGVPISVIARTSRPRQSDKPKPDFVEYFARSVDAVRKKLRQQTVLAGHSMALRSFANTTSFTRKRLSGFDRRRGVAAVRTAGLVDKCFEPLSKITKMGRATSSMECSRLLARCARSFGRPMLARPTRPPRAR